MTDDGWKQDGLDGLLSAAAVVDIIFVAIFALIWAGGFLDLLIANYFGAFALGGVTFALVNGVVAWAYLRIRRKK